MVHFCIGDYLIGSGVVPCLLAIAGPLSRASHSQEGNASVDVLRPCYTSAMKAPINHGIAGKSRRASNYSPC